MIVPSKWSAYSWREFSGRSDLTPPEIHEVANRVKDRVENFRYNGMDSGGSIGDSLPRFAATIAEIHELLGLLQKLFEREMLPTGDMKTAEALQHLSRQLDGIVGRVTIGVSQGVSGGITSELVVDKLAEGLYRALVRSTGMKDDVVEGEKK